MKIDFTNGTINLSKAEAKKAGVINSDMYKELNAVRNQYPNYAVVVIERKTSASSVSAHGRGFQNKTEKYVG